MIKDFLAKVNPKQKKYFNALRTALLALPETEESVEIDEIGGEWCPAYRVRGTDLLWVHFDPERLWVSMPVEPAFEKKVFQDENLDGSSVDAIKEAEDTGGVRWAKMDIKSNEAVDSIIPLVRLRHSVLLS